MAARKIRSVTGKPRGASAGRKRSATAPDPIAAGIAHLCACDPVLDRIIPRVGPYRPASEPPRPLWDILVRSIIHQQISVAAGRTIVRRVCALGAGANAGTDLASPDAPDALPPPALFLASDADTLRVAGLSRQKQRYLRDLAARVADGRLDLARLPALDDEAVIAALTQVVGIGRWSAQMVLIFHLGRLDVLPIDDVGLRGAVQRAYGLPAPPRPRELAALAERWRPYRSLASWYLWQAADLGGL